jgi:hypothetical protein
MERRFITEDQLVHNRVIIGQFSQEVSIEVIPLLFVRSFQLSQKL